EVLQAQGGVVLQVVDELAEDEAELLVVEVGVGHAAGLDDLPGGRDPAGTAAEEGGRVAAAGVEPTLDELAQVVDREAGRLRGRRPGGGVLGLLGLLGPRLGDHLGPWWWVVAGGYPPAAGEGTVPGRGLPALAALTPPIASQAGPHSK